MPGVYTLKLTVDGKTLTQKLNVRIDPRVTTSPAGLKQQFDLSLQAYDGISRARNLAAEIGKRIAELERIQPASPALSKLKALSGGGQQRGGGGQAGAALAIADFPLGRLAGAFTQLLDLLQDADVAPSTQAVAAARDLQTALDKAEKAVAEATK
jgi:hypothetical protein